MNKNKDPLISQIQYLSRYKSIKSRAEKAEDKMFDIMRKIQTPNSTSLVKGTSDKAPRDNAGTLSKFINYIEDLNIQNRTLLKDADIIKKEIEDYIYNTIEVEKQRVVLYLYYIDLLSFKEISDLLKYSYRHIIRLHQKAVEEMILKEKV